MGQITAQCLVSRSQLILICLPPPLLILDFSSPSSSISVCLICLPDGITNILNPEYSLSVTMPFSNQDCCACPFVIIIGKKGPRDAQIDHLGASLIPLCPTVKWQPYYLMTMTPPLARWFLATRSLNSQAAVIARNTKGLLLYPLVKKKKKCSLLRIRIYRPTECRAEKKGCTQHSNRSLGKKRGWTTFFFFSLFLSSYNHVFFFWGYSTIWKPLIQSVY